MNLKDEINQAANDAAAVQLKSLLIRHGFTTIDVNDPASLSTCNHFMDLCGSVALTVSKKREHKDSRKLLEAYGVLSSYDTVVLDYPLRGRQEISVKEAACTAALLVLKSYGISGVSLYSRVD